MACNFKNANFTHTLKIAITFKINKNVMIGIMVIKKLNKLEMLQLKYWGHYTKKGHTKVI